MAAADMLLPILLAASALLTVGGAGLLAWGSRVTRTSHEVEERFERLVRGESLPDTRKTRDLRSTLAEFGSRRLVGKSADQELPVLLAQAGHRGREALALFTALRALAPVVLTAAAGGAWVLSGYPAGVGLVLAGYGVFTLGYLAPKSLLRLRAKARARRIRDDVSALTHLMRVLYGCGLSTEQALQVFAKEQRGVLPDVSIEVGEVMRMVTAGSDLDSATRDIAAEVAIPELADFFGLVRQIDRYGGQVQETLMRFASLLEDRERTRLQEAISRLSAKLTIVMVLFLLPALLTFVGGPGFIAVIRALGEMGG